MWLLRVREEAINGLKVDSKNNYENLISLNKKLFLLKKDCGNNIYYYICSLMQT